MTEPPYSQLVADLADTKAQLERVTRERDEARKERDAYREAIEEAEYLRGSQRRMRRIERGTEAG